MTWPSRLKKKNNIPNREKFTVQTEAHCFMHFHSDDHVTVLFYVCIFLFEFFPIFFLAPEFVRTRRKNFLIRFLPTSLCLCDRGIHYALNCFLLVSHLPYGIRLATLLVECGL